LLLFSNCHKKQKTRPIFFKSEK